MRSKTKGRWYIRTNNKVQGPFPNHLIGSYLVLGRIDLETEVSQDEDNWAPVKNYKALVPEVVLNAHTPEGAKALMLARVREDERRAKAEQNDVDDERRVEDENQVIKLHRQLRDDILTRYHKSPHKNSRNILVTILLVVLFIAAFVLYQPSDLRSGADCDAVPQIGINWSSCNKQGQNFAGMDLKSSQFKATKFNGADFSRARLDGSDLSYASLFHAQMQQTGLQDAILVGANLRQANLRSANLQGADLSYAELVGAKLDGALLINARFDHALWVNGKACLPGSTGACLQTK
jgi:Pentapeptide repeats (9 copies)